MLSIIIATLNEEKGIIKTLEDINKLKIKKEVLVVDGLSKDKTVENAKKHGAKVIVEKKTGKGIAMIDGVKHSKGDVICFTDGDGTYPAKYIPKMLGLLKDCDVVVASRLLLKQNANTSLNTFLHYNLFPAIFRRFYYAKFKTTEPITGFRVMKKSAWNKMQVKSHDFMIETEMEVAMAKNRMKVIEIPIPCVKRVGISKFDKSWKTMIRMVIYAWKNEKYLKNLQVVRHLS
jgi:glycosyltransferase involved in cell wall biosynthesis